MSETDEEQGTVLGQGKHIYTIPHYHKIIILHQPHRIPGFPTQDFSRTQIIHFPPPQLIPLWFTDHETHSWAWPKVNVIISVAILGIFFSLLLFVYLIWWTRTISLGWYNNKMSTKDTDHTIWGQPLGRNTSAGAPWPLPSGLGNSCKFSTNGERDELPSKCEQSNHHWSEPLTPKNHLSLGRMDTYCGDTHRFYVYFEEYTFKHIWIYLKNTSQRGFERQWGKDNSSIEKWTKDIDR